MILLIYFINIILYLKRKENITHYLKLRMSASFKIYLFPISREKKTLCGKFSQYILKRITKE